MPTKTATHMSDRNYLRVPLRVLMSSFTTHVFLYECWQVHMHIFSSSIFVGFELQVGIASLVCTRTHGSLILMCDTVSDVNRLHSFVNLHLSGAVVHAQLTFHLPKHSPYAK